MKETHIRCIFFDLGNVLLGLDYSNFRDRMISLTGLEIERLRAILTVDLIMKYEIGACSDEEFLSEICGPAGANLNPADFLEAWNCIFTQPLLPEEILLELSGKFPLWIISNTNRIHFDFVRKRFRFIGEYFQGWILSYEVGAAKPDPAIYAQAVSKAGIPANEALFIDDLAVNVEAACRFGMDAFQFLNTDQLIQELQNRNIMQQ
jgi:glucose-1-phosphatase